MHRSLSWTIFFLWIQYSLCIILNRLEPVTFVEDSSFAWDISGDPIVYSSHPVSQKWKVFDLTVDEFLSQFEILENVYVSTNKYFTFFDEGKMEKSFFRKNFSQPFSFTRLKGTEFFKQPPLRDSEEPTYRYFFGGIAGPIFSNARPYIEPSLVHNVHGNLWMSTKDSQMPTHYDNLHNVYIQLFGKKRFRLFPHTATGSLCVHGRLHPHGRQSRFRDLSSPEKVVPPNFSDLYKYDSSVAATSSQVSSVERDAEVLRRCSVERLEGLEVELSPGHILSLPPYWYHETRSEEDSVSLSVWLNGTAEAALMAAVYDYPIPFDFGWGQELIYRAGLLYMSLLAREVDRLVNADEPGADSVRVESIDVAGSSLDGAATAIKVRLSVVQLLENRYLDDLLLDDAAFRESEFGACTCDNSDTSPTRLQSTLPNLDWKLFQNSSKVLASLLFRVGDAFAPSLLEPRSSAAVVLTKAADFIEDFFHHISHQEGRNLVAIIAEWTKCRHKNYLKAISPGGC